MTRFSIITLVLLLFSGVGAAHAEVLCPDPEEALGIVPTDLAAVQDDIDRLTLCVKRTQLINQLNDLVEEQRKQDALSETISPTFNHSDSFLAPLPSVPVSQQAAVIDPAVLDENNSETPAQRKSTAKEITDDIWYINRVWGSSGQLRAQLIFNGQAFIVAEGDSLLSGHVVDRISYDSVAIRQGNDVSSLAWYVAQ